MPAARAGRRADPARGAGAPVSRRPRALPALRLAALALARRRGARPDRLALAAARHAGAGRACAAGRRRARRLSRRRRAGLVGAARRLRGRRQRAERRRAEAPAGGSAARLRSGRLHLPRPVARRLERDRLRRARRLRRRRGAWPWTQRARTLAALQPRKGGPAALTAIAERGDRLRRSGSGGSPGRGERPAASSRCGGRNPRATRCTSRRRPDSGCSKRWDSSPRPPRRRAA